MSANDRHKENLLKQGIFPIRKVTLDDLRELCGWILDNRPKNKKFTVLINSSGGSARAVVWFASCLRLFKKDLELTGIAVGECGSAALALLQCCNKRIAVKNTAFFIHHVNVTVKLDCSNPDQDHLENELRVSNAIEAELIEIQCKKSGLSKTEWKRLADNGQKNSGTPILTEQALALGLIDKVVDEFPCL